MGKATSSKEKPKPKPKAKAKAKEEAKAKKKPTKSEQVVEEEEMEAVEMAAEVEVEPKAEEAKPAAANAVLTPAEKSAETRKRHAAVAATMEETKKRQRVCHITAENRLLTLSNGTKEQKKVAEAFEAVTVETLPKQLRDRLLAANHKAEESVLVCRLCKRHVGHDRVHLLAQHLNTKEHRRIAEAGAAQAPAENAGEAPTENPAGGAPGRLGAQQLTALKQRLREALCLSGTTRAGATLISAALRETVGISLPPRSLVDASASAQELKEELKAKVKGHAPVLAIDGWTEPSSGAEVQAIVAVFQGARLLLHVGMKHGEGWTRKELEELLQGVRNEYGLLQNMVVADGASNNPVNTLNGEQVCWCLPHAYNLALKKQLATAFPLAYKVCTDLTRLFRGAACGGRRARWVAYQRAALKETSAQAEQNRLKCDLLALSLAANDVAAVRTLLDIDDDTVADEDVMSKAKTVAEGGAGVVDGDVHTPAAAPKTTTCTRYSSFFESCRYWVPRHADLLGFLLREARRKKRPASVDSVLSMVQDDNWKEARTQMEELVKEYNAWEPFFSFICNPKVGPARPWNVAPRYEAALASAPEGPLRAIFAEVWDSWPHKELCAATSVFDPQRFAIARATGKAPTLEALQTMFPFAAGDELAKYLQADGGELVRLKGRLEFEPEAWWQGNSEAYPQLSKVAVGLLAFPPSVLVVDSVWSVAGTIDCGRLAGAAVEGLKDRLFLKWNLFSQGRRRLETIALVDEDPLEDPLDMLDERNERQTEDEEDKVGEMRFFHGCF